MSSTTQQLQSIIGDGLIAYRRVSAERDLITVAYARTDGTVWITVVDTATRSTVERADPCASDHPSIRLALDLTAERVRRTLSPAPAPPSEISTASREHSTAHTGWTLDDLAEVNARAAQRAQSAERGRAQRDAARAERERWHRNAEHSAAE